MHRLSNGGTVLRQKTWLTLHQEELKPLHSKKSYIFLTKVITVTSLVFTGYLSKNLKERRTNQLIKKNPSKCTSKLRIKHVLRGILNSDKYQQIKSTLDSEGVVRCQGRIGLSSLPYDTTFLVLLPREHYFTRLVILKCHEQVMQTGVAETLVQRLQLRSKYWVVKRKIDS